MDRTKDFLVALFLGPEVATVLVIVIIRYAFASTIDAIGEAIVVRDAPIQYLAGVPAIVLGYVVAERKQLLFPESAANEILQEWPDYHSIVTRYYLTFGWALLATAIGVGCWAFGELSDVNCLIALLGAVLLSLATFVPFFHATYKLKRLLEGRE